MPGRVRELNLDSPRTGHMFNVFYPGDGWEDRTSHWRDYSHCTDVVGERENANPLTLVHNTSTVMELNGKLINELPPFEVLREYKKCPLPDGAVPIPSTLAKYPPFTGSELNAFLVTLLARTNPNRPHVSVPTFIGELKDLPLLVRNHGRGLLQQVASGTLSYRWMVAPMISDIKKMLDFQGAVERRVVELRALSEGGFISKRAFLDSDEETIAGEIWLAKESQLGLLYCKEDLEYTSRVWGSAQWKLDSSTFSLPTTDLGRIKLARRQVLGLNWYEALPTAWELVPWSWLIDWFGNYGELLAARRNSMPMKPGLVCVMRTATARVNRHSVGGFESDPWINYTRAGEEKQERKERYPLDGSAPLWFDASVPFLSKGKLEILGSLAVLRFRRRV